MTADWAWRTAQPSGRPIATMRPGLGWVFFLSTIALARALSASAGPAGESGDAAAQLGTNKKGKIHFAREKKSWAGGFSVCLLLPLGSAGADLAAVARFRSSEKA